MITIEQPIDIVSKGMGFAKNWKHMVATRALLGILEAGNLLKPNNPVPSNTKLIGFDIGYFPGCVYLLSSWYTRCEYKPTIRATPKH